MYSDYKKSGIIHKLVGTSIRKKLYNGIPSLEIVENIENEIKKYTKYDINNPWKSGVGFPVGISQYKVVQ